MKKIFFLMGITVLASSLQAQKIQMGLKAGINIANLKTDNINYNSMAGFHGGLLAHIHLNRNWAIQPELVYSMQGAKYDDILNLEHREKLDYLNIPVLVQYMTASGFRLQAGPQIGFLLSAKDEIAGRKTDLKDNRESIDFSLGFGMGFLSKIGLGVDARLNVGLNDIRKTSGPKLKNDVVQLGIFYQFKSM